jgi:hypothetical protein
LLVEPGEAVAKAAEVRLAVTAQADKLAVERHLMLAEHAGDRR